MTTAHIEAYNGNDFETKRSIDERLTSDPITIGPFRIELHHDNELMGPASISMYNGGASKGTLTIYPGDSSTHILHYTDQEQTDKSVMIKIDHLDLKKSVKSSTAV
jgi:hypothetical protein